MFNQQNPLPDEVLLLDPAQAKKDCSGLRVALLAILLQASFGSLCIIQASIHNNQDMVLGQDQAFDQLTQHSTKQLGTTEPLVAFMPTGGVLLVAKPQRLLPVCKVLSLHCFHHCWESTTLHQNRVAKDVVEHTSLCTGTARITDHQPVLKPKVSVMGVECIGIPKANNFSHAKTILGIFPPEPVNVLRNALSFHLCQTLPDMVAPQCESPSWDHLSMSVL